MFTISRKILFFTFLGLLMACNQALPPIKPSVSPSPLATPTILVSPSPDSDAFKNPQIHSTCWGSLAICPEGKPCPMASCLPDPPPLNQEAPLFIEESEFEKLKQRFDLFSVQRAEDELGGLSPQLPMAKALKRDCNGSGLYHSGGRLNACVMYIVQNGPDNYSLIQNAAEAARVFAPIESREEAVSYAAMLTGYDAIYQLPKFETNWRYYYEGISPTHVSQSDFGYKLNLDYYQFFGCGPHPHFQVDLTLTQAGVLQEVQRTKLYEEPDKDGLCVD